MPQVTDERELFIQRLYQKLAAGGDFYLSRPEICRRAPSRVIIETLEPAWEACQQVVMMPGRQRLGLPFMLEWQAFDPYPLPEKEVLVASKDESLLSTSVISIIGRKNAYTSARES